VKASGSVRQLSGITVERAAALRAAASRSKRSVKNANRLAPLLPKGLDPSREASILKRLAQMPVSQRNTYLRAIRGRSLTAGVKANCLECMGYDRAQIPDCPDTGCALWPYRPFQSNLDDPVDEGGDPCLTS